MIIIVQLEYQSAAQGQQMAKSHEASMGAAERRVAERKRKVKEKKEAIARKARKAALADGTEQEMDRVRVTIFCFVLCCCRSDLHLLFILLSFCKFRWAGPSHQPPRRSFPPFSITCTARPVRMMTLSWRRLELAIRILI
jgi:hypothetical protein